jgi:hypothetical protein
MQKNVLKILKTTINWIRTEKEIIKNKSKIYNFWNMQIKKSQLST